MASGFSSFVIALAPIACTWKFLVVYNTFGSFVSMMFPDFAMNSSPSIQISSCPFVFSASIPMNELFRSVVEIY